MEEEKKLFALDFCKSIVDAVKDDIRFSNPRTYYPTSYAYELATRIEKTIRDEFKTHFDLTDTELDEFFNEQADD